MGDFPFLEHLSLKYLDIAAESKHWTDYIKAHGLANASLARDPTREDIKRRIYGLESHWYNGSHPTIYCEHQQRIVNHKCQLRKLRDNTEHKLDILEPLQASLSTDTLFSRENVIKLLKFSDEVFKMSSDCTTNLVEFSRSIIISSMDLLESPPCSFAVIGLGSLARGEATPYSDIEYGFIVESGFSNHKYFTDLAIESYFCIGNLGESPLKCFYIEELYVEDEKGEKLFVDRPPVNGFKIDGISPKAGNIPTGHGREGGKRLILSVEEAMSLYKSTLMAPADPDLPGDISDLLFSPVLIYGHKGGEKLLDQFMAKRKVYESSVATTDPQSKDKRLNTLATDIIQHPFIPEFEFSERLKSSSIQVKSDIFRYPTLLLANLKILSNLDTNYPWETVQWFQDNHALSPGNSAYLKIVLGLSIFIRTKAYLALGSQYELLSLQPAVEGSQQHDIPIDRFHVPQAIFLTLGCLLIPIKRSIEKSIVKARSSSYHLSGVVMPDIIRSVLREFHVVDDFLVKAEVFHFMGIFTKALETIKSAVGESSVCEAVKFRQAVLREYPDQQPDVSVNKSLEMMASILLRLDRHEAALDYFTWLSVYSKSDAERIPWDMQSVPSLIALKNYKGAETKLRQIDISLRNVLSIERSTPLYTHAISLLKSAGDHKSCIDAALTWSYIIFLIYMHYFRAREDYLSAAIYHQAFKDVACAEQILAARASLVDIRHDLQRLYSSKGAIHLSVGEYNESEKVFTKSLDICKSLYGSDSANDDIAFLYCNITTLYIFTGKYSQAEQLAHQTLVIRNQLYGNKHHVTMVPMHQLGVAYYFQGKYLDALKLLRKVLKVHQNSKNVIDPEAVIRKANYMLGEMYNSLGEYTSAYNILCAADYLDTPLGLLVMTSYDTNMYTQYLPSVMRSLEKFMPQETDAMVIFMLYLGEVCIDLSKWSEALEYLSASLSITKAGYHNQKTLLSISEVWKCLKQYKTAVLFSTLVLRSEVETPDTHTGEAHYIIGDCYMRLGLYKESWSHLHSALCLYQNLPKYRSFVLMLAKTHLSIALLLFKLCRVSESSEHAIKAVQLTDGLISDQEKTTWKVIDMNQQTVMLRDTVEPGYIFGPTQSRGFRKLGPKRQKLS